MRSPQDPKPLSTVYRSNLLTAAPDPTNVVGGAGSVALTLTVDRAGGSILIDTDNRSAVDSPSGSWPYTVQFAIGQGTTATITLATHAVAATTTVHIRGCDASLDIGDPTNWQAVAEVTIEPA